METEYLRVDSQTIIHVELHCVTSRTVAPEEKAALKKKILELAKDDIQDHVEKFNRKRKKSTLTKKRSSELKNDGTVIRGEDVRFIFEFTGLSITHRVLTRDMKKDSKFRSSEVFPEKLVIYYQPYCKSAMSSYFIKPDSTTGQLQHMKTTLSNIVSKSGPKLSKVKKKKWHDINILEEEGPKVAEMPDPFKEMTIKGERDMGTRMKIALVKDNLLMLRADMASPVKENTSPRQCSETCQEKPMASEDTSVSCSTGCSDVKCNEDAKTFNEGPALSEVSLSSRSHPENFEPENIENYIADFDIEMNEEFETDADKHGIVTTETKQCDIQSTSLKSSDDDGSTPDTPESLLTCDRFEEESKSNSESETEHDSSDTDLPQAFVRPSTTSIKTGDDIGDIPSGPSDHSVFDSDNESTCNDLKEIVKPVLDNLGEKSPTRLPSKTSERISLKVAMIDLSDSDSDSGTGTAEPCMKDVLGNNFIKSKPAKTDDIDVFKKPMLSVRVKDRKSERISSDVCRKDADSSKGPNKEKMTGSDSSDVPFQEADDCSDNHERKRTFRDDFAECDMEILPSIVKKKRLILKKRKEELFARLEATPKIGTNVSDDLPTITASKSKLRRLGPKIQTKSSKNPSVYITPDPLQCVANPSDSITPDPLQSVAKDHRIESGCEAKDAPNSDEEDTDTVVATSSFQEIMKTTDDPSAPVYIEDETSDRFLMEISEVDQVKHLTEEQLEYLVTSNISYVKAIFKGKSYCERHEKYKKGKRQQILLRNDVPMGQFRESQHDVVMNILMKVFCKDNSKYFDYMCKVMLPEMLIKVCMDVQHLSHSEAESALDTVNMSQMVHC